MSFDIPLHIADDSPEARVIEAIVLRDHVSPEEVIRRALRGLAVTRSGKRPSGIKRKGQNVPSPITDEELAHLDKICPALRLLDDVTDETWDGILNGARKMNREGFAHRA